MLRMLNRVSQCCSGPVIHCSGVSHSLSRCLQLAIKRCASTALLDVFFDDKENWGKRELRPIKRPGRAWSEDELRLKSNSDLHKLWYVLLKERNMLLTMEAAYSKRMIPMPNPERIYRVNESMQNIEKIVHERNDAYFRLETGVGVDPPERTVTSFAGFTYKKPAEEHYLSAEASGKKEYEIPYLDDDAYMMQKLWAEKEHWKKRDADEDAWRNKMLTEDMRRFQQGSPRVINKVEQMGPNNGF